MKRWSPDFENLVTSILEEALTAPDLETQEACRQKLLALGLSEEQCETGFTAGVIQLAHELDRQDILEQIHADLCEKYPDGHYLIDWCRNLKAAS